MTALALPPGWVVAVEPPWGQLALSPPGGRRRYHRCFIADGQRRLITRDVGHLRADVHTAR